MHPVKGAEPPGALQDVAGAALQPARMAGNAARERVVANTAAPQDGQHEVGPGAAEQEIHAQFGSGARRGGFAGHIEADDLQIECPAAIADRRGQTMQIGERQAQILEADMAQAACETLRQPVHCIGNGAIRPRQHEDELRTGHAGTPSPSTGAAVMARACRNA